MSVKTEKRDAYDNAVSLLEREDDSLLRYAALEARRCLEAVVYEKLWAYRDRFGPKLGRRWQPVQAFKVLLALEPEAADTKRIFIGSHKEVDVPGDGPAHYAGEDVRPPLDLLEKNHKLGGLLHARFPFGKTSPFEDPAALRGFLDQVLAELQPCVESNITMTSPFTTSLDCVKCEFNIVVSHLAVQMTGLVDCFNPECALRYRVGQREDGSFWWEVAEHSHVVCGDCGEKVLIPSYKLSEGFRFACLKCSVEHEVSIEWNAKVVRRPGIGAESEKA